MLGLDALEPHPVLAKADRLAGRRVLEVGQYACDAVHVQAEQILDPVIRIRASTRGRTHLRDPRPDRRRGSVDRDRARRDPIGVLEQLVARQARDGFDVRRAPVEHTSPQQQCVEDAEQRSRSQCNVAESHLVR